MMIICPVLSQITLRSPQYFCSLNHLGPYPGILFVCFTLSHMEFSFVEIIKCLHDSALPLDLRLQTGGPEMPFRPQKVPFGQI